MVLVNLKTLVVILSTVMTTLLVLMVMMVMLVQEQAVAIMTQEWTFLMILIWLMVATLVQEWTLAVILIQAKAMVTTLSTAVTTLVLMVMLVPEQAVATRVITGMDISDDTDMVGDTDAWTGIGETGTGGTTFGDMVRANTAGAGTNGHF